MKILIITLLMFYFYHASNQNDFSQLDDMIKQKYQNNPNMNSLLRNNKLKKILNQIYQEFGKLDLDNLNLDSNIESKVKQVEKLSKNLYKQYLQAYDNIQTLTEEEWSELAYMAAKGLNITDFYDSSIDCINQTRDIFFIFRDQFYEASNSQFTLEQFLNITLTIGNLSTLFKFCYEDGEELITFPYQYIMSFGGMLNYTIALIPNILSYTVIIPQWVEAIEYYERTNNITGKTYYVAYIIRVLIYFDPPLQQSSPTQEKFHKFQQLDKYEQQNKMKLYNRRKQLKADYCEIDPGRITNFTIESTLQILNFTFQTPFWLIMNMRLMQNSSYTYTCYDSFLQVYNQTTYAIKLTDQMAFKEFRIKDFKPISFAYVSILEHIYPICAFCTSMPFEIEREFLDLQMFAKKPDQIFLNILYKLGSILYNSFTFLDYLNDLDGYEFGGRLGLAIGYILDISELI